MSKISYNRVRSSANMLKGAQEIGSVAGAEFSNLREDLAYRIQQTSAEYRFLIARARDVQIGSASSTSSIAVEDILDDAKALLEQSHQSTTVNDVDILADVLPHCLRTSNAQEVAAQHIILSDKTAQSVKLTNIVFRHQEFCKIILDLLFFCNGFSELSALEMIGKVLYIVLDLLGSIAVKFDDECKNVLLALYKNAPSNQGIQEEKLIAILSDKMDSKSYHSAVKQLCEYKCVEIIDGYVYPVESIGFSIHNE